MEMSSGAFLKMTLFFAGFLLVTFAGITAYVDPLFHYHAPNKAYQYPLYDERYMNDGIVRHFEYEALITGTSMTENFKASQFEDLFGVKTIKVPFSGASLKETADLLDRAYGSGKLIKYVLRSMDTGNLIADKNAMSYDDYPDYLYDNRIFNDVYYLLNKDVYLTYTEYVFTYNRLNGVSTDFDTYKNWSWQYEYNREKLISEHTRPEIQEMVSFTNEDDKLLRDNLEQNVIRFAKEHPETEFYLFDPPYSVLWMDDELRIGQLERMMTAWEHEAKLLLEYDNIHYFSFYDDTDITCNLNNYKDTMHYSQQISDELIKDMANGEHEINKDNCSTYFRKIRELYSQYDYNDIYK